MDFYNYIVPEINFALNTFYSNDTTVYPPTELDKTYFFKEHVNKVLLPYNTSDASTNLLMFLDEKILNLKKIILNEIAFYKVNNFTFNYNRSFFYNFLKKLNELLTNAPTNINDNIYSLQLIQLLKEQIDLFNPKLDKLDKLLQILNSITTNSKDTPIIQQLLEFLNGLNNELNKIIIIIIKISDPDLQLLRRKIYNLIEKLNKINAGTEKLSQDKQDEIEKYFSIVQLLNELYKNDDDKFQIIKQKVKTKFNSLYSDYKIFNKIYREKDLQIMTTNLNEPIKQLERNNLLKIAINNKRQLFGHYQPNQFKRVFLPYYISIKNIVEIIKLVLTNEITQDELDIFIYNYNTLFYEIHIGNDDNNIFYINSSKFSYNKNYFKIPINYIYEPTKNNFFTDYNKNEYVKRIFAPTKGIQHLTNKSEIKYLYIPITQPINKIYDNAIKKFLFESDVRPKGSYLKIYNNKHFIMTQIYINIENKTYYFKMNGIEINIPLYDLIKNEVLKEILDEDKRKLDKPLQIYYTDYNYSYTTTTTTQNININILTFYEDIYIKNKIENTFGFIQTDYNLYILIEQFKKKMKLKQQLFVEDFILCMYDTYNNLILKNTLTDPFNYINVILDEIKNTIVDPLQELFDGSDQNPLLEEIDYYYANEKSKEIIYKESRRGIVMIRLIVIILYVARIYFENSISYFEGYENFIKIYFIKIINLYYDEYNIKNLINGITSFFKKNIDNGVINKDFLNSIIDGSLFSKNKHLFLKKENILQTSIESVTENIENITSEMDKFIKLPTDPSLKGMDALKDTYDKLSTNVMDYFQKEPDYTNTPINITDFEEKNFSLTADVLQNRAKKWITGPIYKCEWEPINENYLNVINNNIVCPDVIQFVSEYMNNKSGTDLVSVKNKEQICKNISLLKNIIEKNTSDIKYILPKTFFDDEMFITNFSKKLDNVPNEKKKKDEFKKKYGYHHHPLL